MKFLPFFLSQPAVTHDPVPGRMSMFAITDQTTDSNLRALTIEKKQFGNYSCRAENRLGTTEAAVELVGQLAGWGRVRSGQVRSGQVRTGAE